MTTETPTDITRDRSYRVITQEGRSAAPVKAWVEGVEMDDGAREQLERVAQLPFIHKWVAAMPDVHWGIGATVGSVIPTKNAIIPAAVGVDIGCGMVAVETTLEARHLPDSLKGVRSSIERAVPHGRTNNGRKGDRGAWRHAPDRTAEAWADLERGFASIVAKHKKVAKGATFEQLGTLGGGNHFIEVCLDERDHVWVMLHSGSRGVGNRIGRYFIELAKRDAERWFLQLPDKDLAYFPKGAEHFDDYVEAVGWAQDYAAVNRRLMVEAVIEAMERSPELPPFERAGEVVNCHHNYVRIEHHYGENVYVTRKGAVRAGKGELGIIPGSMGARSYIVRGLGNPESFESCSHGAGRRMSRAEARRRITVEEHRAATEGVECRKDASVIDESPAAYKSIDDVMHAQRDLVETVHTLRQVVCVKG